MYSSKDIPKITTHGFQEMKQGEKDCYTTAYDYSMADYR